MNTLSLTSILVGAMIASGFITISFSTLASAQNQPDLPPGSVLIPQEQIDRLCNPGDFNWALRNHFRGIRLTSEQRRSIRPIYENYRQELRSHLRNGQCTVIAPGVDRSFSEGVRNGFLKYVAKINRILSEKQHDRWVRNVNNLWAPPIRF